ncbi:S8 family peptidase [Geodermatophilus sp. SYSU D00965]
MHTRRSMAAAALAVLATAGLGATAGPVSAAPGSPLASYVVTVDPDRSPAGLAQRARGLGGEVSHVYTAALNGFAVRLPVAAAAQLSRLAGVLDVEPDQVVQARPTKSSSPSPSAPPWGLDRIDQRALPLSETYRSAHTGAGVTAYVIDTGIRYDHEDLRDRLVPGYDAVDGGTAEDCNGHGTHVAGTIGGTKKGVAAGVTLVPVRVLDCSGSGAYSDVLAGIDWVTAQHETAVEEVAAGLRPSSDAVANLSLGGPVSDALDQAVANAIDAGITVAVAAGNGNQAGRPQDACTTSPARVRAALTVAASDSTDTSASFSNYGTCVDLYAPGVGVTSDWYTGSSATSTISGTSMAAPHVAGVAALYLQEHPGAGPAVVAAAIAADATTGVVKRTLTGTPNRLLFTAPATTAG